MWGQPGSAHGVGSRQLLEGLLVAVGGVTPFSALQSACPPRRGCLHLDWWHWGSLLSAAGQSWAKGSPVHPLNPLALEELPCPPAAQA